MQQPWRRMCAHCGQKAVVHPFARLCKPCCQSLKKCAKCMKEQAEVCEPGVVLDFDQSKKGISREGLTTSAEFIVYDIYLHIQRILCAIAFGMFCLDFIHIKMHPIIMGFFLYHRRKYSLCSSEILRLLCRIELLGEPFPHSIVWCLLKRQLFLQQ